MSRSTLKKYSLSAKQIREISDAKLRNTWEGATFEREENEKEFLKDRSTFWDVDPANAEIYDPGPRQRVPEGGAWAMITRQFPGIEGAIDKKVRVGRIFYLEHENNADKFGFLPDGTYKVKLHSPWGDVSLFPYEYAVQPVDSVMLMWQEKELIFHPTNVELGRMNDIVHYARSRGIGLADALVMALGTLRGAVGWFEPRKDIAKEMEAMEERVHRWKPKPRKNGKQLAVQVIVKNDPEIADAKP